MGRLTIWASILLAALPAAARAQYETPVNPPDPAAQLAELIEIYDAVCLRAFPDDAAMMRAVTARGGAAMSEHEVRGILRNDPGRGWTVAGRTAQFRITLETPPYHTCGVRTMTAAGFPDMAPYRRLADRFEAGGGYRQIHAMTMELENVHVSGAGEQRDAAGGAESLLVFLSTPSDKVRDAAHNAIEVRFAHQIYAGP